MMSLLLHFTIPTLNMDWFEKEKHKCKKQNIVRTKRGFDIEKKHFWTVALRQGPMILRLSVSPSLMPFSFQEPFIRFF